VYAKKILVDGGKSTRVGWLGHLHGEIVVLMDID